MEENRAATPLKGVSKFWNGLSGLLKGLIIGGAVLLVGLVAFLAIRAGSTEYETLYVNLDAQQAAECYTLLEELGYDVQIQGTGTIKVPKGKADEARLRLQQEGFPQSGFDYSIYAQGASLGSTEADRRNYEQYQAEQHIAQTLERFDIVEDATVKVVLQETSQFALSDNKTPATATVVLKLRQGYSLSASEAETIRNSVAAAVAGLSPENVILSDTSLRLYREGEDDFAVASSDRLSLIEKTQELIQNQVYNLLAPVFGSANVTVSASVDLNFDKHNTQTITYSPPGDAENMGIIVSMRQTAERMADDPTASGVVGFDANGAAPWYPGMTDESDATYYQYTQELNAEVNEVREQIEEAQGDITSLSVAVFLDADEEWEAELENIRSMVASAVGVDAEYINIMLTPFKVNEDYHAMVAEQEAAEAQQAIKDEEAARNRMIIILASIGAVLLIAAATAIIIALRKRAARRAAEREEERKKEEERQAQQIAIQEALAQETVEEDSEATKRLNYIRELTENSPEMIAQLLRNWLTDEYGR